MRPMKSDKARKRNNISGFTLVEIMIVIAIVGILASFVGINVIERFKKAQVDAARIQIKNFESVLQTYYLDNNRFPSTQQGLEALVKRPSGNWLSVTSTSHLLKKAATSAL